MIEILLALILLVLLVQLGFNMYMNLPEIQRRVAKRRRHNE
jgi:hypothetical protein